MAAVGRARQKAESPIKSPLPSALYVQASEKVIDNVKGFFVLWLTESPTVPIFDAMNRPAMRTSFHEKLAHCSLD